MMDMARRLVWFGIVSSMVAYGTLMIAGGVVQARESRSVTIIRDELAPGVHHLSGMVMVPSTCDQLLVRTDTISSSTYALVFRTWSDSSVSCQREEVPRVFRAVVFAPSTNVRFIATLDDIALPIVVHPYIPVTN